MGWSLLRTVDPTLTPLTLEAAKRHVRVDTSDEDPLISSLIFAAWEYVELRTGIVCLPSTWQLVLDRWPRLNAVEQWPWPGIPAGAILLPRFPVTSVTSIVWKGTDGSTNTVAGTDYSLDAVSRPPRVTPNYLKSWANTPSLIPQGGVVVTFVAGYADANRIPATLKQAMLLILGHWFANREAVLTDNRVAAIQLPQAAETLLGLWQAVQVG